MRFALLPCILVLLVSCGSESPACEIKDNGDGTRTISCPGTDPIRVAAGEGICTITEFGENDKIISCQNGETIEIRDGRVLFKGYGFISGIALLFGLDEHDGIRVYVETADVEAITGTDGRFQIELPAGIHNVRFEAPGRTPQRVMNVPVIRDTWDMGVVVLRSGRHVATPRETVLVSPDETAITSFDSQGPLRGGWLHLTELDEEGLSEPIRLGSHVMAHEFDRDGGRLLYQERTAIDGPLHVYDRASGENTTVSLHSMAGRFVLGGEAVFHEARHEDGRCELRLWRVADGATETIAACERVDTRGKDPILAVDGAGSVVVYVDEFSKAWVLDLETGASMELAGGGEIVELTLLPGGYVLFQTDAGGFVRWYTASATREPFSIGVPAGVNAPTVSSGGEWIAMIADHDASRELRLHEVETGTNVPVASSANLDFFEFSPNGKHLLWVDGGLPAVLDLGAPDTVWTWPGLAVQKAELSGIGGQVVALDELNALLRWDPIRNTLEQLDPAGIDWFWNGDRTRLFAGVAGGTLHLDMLDGSIARSDVEVNDPMLPSVAWEQDSPGVLFGRTVTRDDGGTEFLLYRWDPRQAPDLIHRGGAFSRLGAAVGSTTAYIESGGSFPRLMFFHPEADAPEFVDEPVDSSWGVQIVGKLLLYKTDAGGSGQEGVHVIRMGPADTERS